MDEDANPIFLRIGMLGFMIFMLSFIKSCSELKYYMTEKEATARVTKIYETSRRGRHTGWHVSYKFLNEDTDETQNGYLLVGDEDAGFFSVGQELPIEYIGSSHLDSRLIGDSNRTWIHVFLVSMLVTLGSVAFLSWQSMQEEKKSRRRR